MISPTTVKASSKFVNQDVQLPLPGKYQETTAPDIADEEYSDRSGEPLVVSISQTGTDIL